ncbi:addiction module protein [Thiohalobacter sp. IOR34]|uniref:addiction module protein n=1 Tax=Thiohalobacter sp. IOR34 TaxID=3057176 RepID=UPI0025B0E86E|nr:addiction module protein [Thiohalobacter sp. IOR34]WJW76179.1 addiction module protein [Thiohalobacter sp. IOR34]
MVKTVEELEREIRSLSDDDRNHLLRDLVADLDGERDPEVEKAWLEEAQRRFRELKDGVVEGISSRDVFKNSRNRLNK